jgi:hypothetical protein
LSPAIELNIVVGLRANSDVGLLRIR